MKRFKEKKIFDKIRVTLCVQLLRKATSKFLALPFMEITFPYVVVMKLFRLTYYYGYKNQSNFAWCCPKIFGNIE